MRLAARDFLFLCSLALVLFFIAKAVTDILPFAPYFRGVDVPQDIYVYLIPLPAFAMVVRILLNSEVAILFTVAASARPADVNGDGTVNLLDLLAVLAAWGPGPGCPEDVNGDGTVNAPDLLLYRPPKGGLKSHFQHPS